MQKKTDDKPEDKPAGDAMPYAVNDPQAFVLNMLRVIEEGSKATATLLERSRAGNGRTSAAGDMGDAARTMTEISKYWLNEPSKIVEAQGRLVHDYLDIWNNTFTRMMGGEAEPVARPGPGDNRFRDPEWDDNAYFNFWKQLYLVTAKWADEVVENAEGVDEPTRQKADFYVRLFASAFAPSNFPLTNPEVMRETFASNGENLVRGMEHFARDVERSKDLLKISQTDVDAFEVGRNLAITPGKVVYQNDILQLIQYTPATEKVYQIPLLIAPPWINKFYILDLVPEKSLIKYAVDQGFTVFVISWVNPDERHGSRTFEDYMTEGLLEAADVVREITGQDQTNVLGYCVGGTLLGTTLAWLARRGEAPFRSATFLTAQLDFSHAGDLLVFTDESRLASLEEMMAERGYLDGSRMAQVFNMLRPRDLIWPYIVNNYLLGKKPFPFDLLFWNQDSTRMPPANHSFYLREFYGQNALARGEMEIAGETLDLGEVALPVYELATREDHIAPAASVFIGARLLGGDVRFTVAGSGHIAGVVNPPHKHKYQHWTDGSPNADTLADWLESATEHPGSWWPDWTDWLASHSGRKVDARDPGGGPYEVIEDAPGSYVRVKA